VRPGARTRHETVPAAPPPPRDVGLRGAGTPGAGAGPGPGPLAAQEECATRLARLNPSVGAGTAIGPVTGLVERLSDACAN
jgi:hypothetical protein